ncbi:hypothetical protein PS15m_006225 [Mucor circinelloides]
MKELELIAPTIAPAGASRTPPPTITIAGSPTTEIPAPRLPNSTRLVMIVGWRSIAMMPSSAICADGAWPNKG